MEAHHCRELIRRPRPEEQWRGRVGRRELVSAMQWRGLECEQVSGRIAPAQLRGEKIMQKLGVV